MIKISNVNFKYENAEEENLRDISLSIKKGECILLCGQSGCGKTTVTRLINGLIPHFYEGELQGEIKVDGLDVKNTELYDIAKRVGSVFQNPRSQFFCLDTTSEMFFGCENLGLSKTEIEKRTDSEIEKMKLKNLMGRNIFNLSGGEKQKIACGSISAMEPDVYVLDEPTSNLDMKGIAQLKNILKQWKKQGKTIVIAEHRLHWIKDACDKVVYMKEGRIEKIFSGVEFKNLSEEEIHKLGLRGLVEDVCFPQKIEESSQKISFKNYKFSYEKEEKLCIDNLEVPMESVVAVIGDNGAGKTTFSRCLCGLEKKFSGTTIIDNKKNNWKKMLNRCYMVMQDVNHQLFCENVEDEVKLGMKKEKLEKVDEVLRKLNLENYKERHPMSLSGGQKQRVAIGSAFLADKEILVFDEPTSGLDYVHMKETAKLLKKLKKEGKTVFVITHDPELIAMCCTHILHIENGKLKKFYSLIKDNTNFFLESFSY